ncbi:5'-nucleotidase C-terminal domain-containing protein [Salsuginibacillus kocurii]|uniref:5'-nucleotidase C-terminal domain-containing protein n=1 Tax=Salsuginibacillus kocurii TaxID=427078 RepID=UPI00035C980F|nr:5'-nucleotidase C-terminal domain-containing protein [Salsuginibacillus kocurii]
MKKINRKRWVKLGVMSLSATVAFGITQSPAQAENETELTIIHTNDIHSSIEGFAELSALLDEKRAESDHVLFLDGGDIFSGDPVVDLQDGEPIIELLNEVGLDALAVGNHEFDYGQEAYASSVEQSGFSWLSANTEVVDDSIPIEQPDAYEVFELPDLDVAVLGLTQAPPATAPAGIEGLEFHEYAETAEEYEYLQEENDVVIGLTHIGLYDDVPLAEEIEYFDLLVGGHSHTVLHEPQVENGTPIVQAGSDLNYIGEVTLTIDEDAGEVTNVDGMLHDMEDLEAADEDVQEMIDTYLEDAEEILEEVVGETNTGLTRDGRYERDVGLGNFWTDAMAEAFGADLAVTNNGGIRASIDPGEITANDIYTVEPFGNEIMEIEISGEVLRDVIEFSYTREDRNQIDLQTSGLHYEIYVDDDGEYVDAELWIDGDVVEDDELYRAAVPDYIGTGGSGYDFDGEVIQDGAGEIATSLMLYAEQLMEEEGTIDFEDEGEARISIEPAPEEEDEDEEEIPVPEFTDIEGDWAEANIVTLAEAGLVTGYENGEFRPENDMTRAELVTLLVRASDLEESDYEADFSDVEGDEYYAGYLQAAADAGYVQGHVDGSFRGSAEVNRLEAALLLARFAGIDTDEFDSEVSFEDIKDIAEEAQQAIEWLAAEGYIHGYPDGTFQPGASLQRNEMAAMLSGWVE